MHNADESALTLRAMGAVRTIPSARMILETRREDAEKFLEKGMMLDGR